jgi:hypothetical protein
MEMRRVQQIRHFNASKRRPAIANAQLFGRFSRIKVKSFDPLSIKVQTVSLVDYFHVHSRVYRFVNET